MVLFWGKKLFINVSMLRLQTEKIERHCKSGRPDLKLNRELLRRKTDLEKHPL